LISKYNKKKVIPSNTEEVLEEGIIPKN